MEESDPVPLNLARDIPDDGLMTIAAFLSAQEILNLGRACRKLASALNSDGVWEPKILYWIAEQDVRSGILDWSAEKMKELLGLQTLRATYQALILMKAWPHGLWYSPDMHLQPEGNMVWVSHHRDKEDNAGGCSFEFQLVGCSSDFTYLEFPWPPERMRWGFYRREPNRRTHGFLCALEIQPKKGVFCSEVVDVIGEKTTDPKTMPFEVHFDKYRRDQFLVKYQSDRNMLARRKDPDGCWTWCRAGVLDPQDQPPMPPAGLYSAVYGKHGMEIVELNRCFSYNYAYKLTGDKNVPACQISFQFDSTLEDARPGPYDAHRDDPYPNANGPRPVVQSVYNDEPKEFDSDTDEYDDGRILVEVNMEARPVSLIVQNERTRIQINQDPEEWDPEWLDATVILYDDSKMPGAKKNKCDLKESERVAFSLIIEDPEEDSRLLMDFYRVQLPQGFYDFR